MYHAIQKTYFGLDYSHSSCGFLHSFAILATTFIIPWHEKPQVQDGYNHKFDSVEITTATTISEKFGIRFEKF